MIAPDEDVPNDIREGLPYGWQLPRGRTPDLGPHKGTPCCLPSLIAIPLLLIWILTLVDLFRRHDLSGGRKVLWASWC